MQIETLEAHKNAFTPFSSFSRALHSIHLKTQSSQNDSLEKEEVLHVAYEGLLLIV
jgi:fructose-bisphosphate aldolase class 1